MRNIGAVILAAGSSSRLGKPKQVLRLGDGTLLRHSALAALRGGCSPVVVVTGAYAEECSSAVHGLDVRIIFNRHWERGMASSVRSGIEALVQLAPRTAAVVLMVCDQPYISGDVISRIIAAHLATDSTVIASTYAGTFGVPALFTKSLFNELTHLKGNAGAKHVIMQYATETHFVSFPGGEVDVDTADDLVALDVR